MAGPWYGIETDPARSMLRIKLFGHWSPDICTIFVADVDKAFVDLARQGCRPGNYLLLVDAREHGIHSQDVATLLEGFAVNIRTMVRRTAILTSSTLHKVQVKRIAPTHKLGFFASEADALEWLLVDADDP